MLSSSSPPPSLGSGKKRLRAQVEEDEEESVWCGICYAKRGVSIAGEIDCCKHYFCFACIMEWSKRESRCPICRQRFSNVRRLPMHGAFSSPRDIKIPLRDQGCHHDENSVTDPINPFGENKCLICCAGTNEHLLRCNYCETFAHTYCVGLGYTIPYNDWYCHNCDIAREAYLNKESDEENIAPEAEANVTIDICDIVRETSSRVVRRPRASPLEQDLSSSLEEDLSSPSVIPLHDRLSRLKGKRPVINMRNIQAVRENWNDLRSGSLQFRGNSCQPDSTVSQKQDSSSLSHHKLNDSHSMASTCPQQSIAQRGPSNKTLDERIIDKAWEMMDRAKRMTRPPHQRTRSIPHGADNPSCSRGAREITSGHLNLPVLKDQLSKALELRSTKKEKQCDYSRLNRSMENCHSLKLEEKKKSRVTCEEMIHVRDHTIHSEEYCERPLSRMVHSGIQAVPCRENGDMNVAEEQNSSACLVTSADLASSRDKLGSVSSSNKDMDLINEGKRLAKNSEDGNTRKNDDAKTEIQSLVKLNLKLLTRDEKLGVDTFKLVARQATHTILAACSSEHQKSNTSSSSPVCSHADQILEIQKSNLMPNYCRQCFYAFVNNVVNSVLLEKVGGCP